MPVNTSTGRGQYACFVRRASEDASHELLTNTANTGTAGSTVSTVAGLAYKPASTASQWSMVSTGVDPYVTGDFSVFWYGILDSNVSEILLQCHGPYGWTLRVGPWAPGASALIFEAFWGPSPIAFVISTDGVTPVSIGAAYDDSATSITLYFNGSSVGSGSYTKDTGAMGGTQAFYMTGDASTPQKCVTVQAFSVLFDGTDFSALHADPFDIFVAPPLDLTADNCVQANAAGTGSIGINGALVAANSTQANSSGTGQITRTQDLTGANSTQANASGTGSIDPYGRLRAIIAATPTNEWVKVSTNSFLDVTIPTASLPPPPDSLGNNASVIYAWSSFAWDEANGNIVMFGGGHANYYGDETYIWKGDTGEWQLGSLPSLVDFDDASACLPSKDAPQSSHTYSNNVWLPNNRMFCTFGGAAANSGGPMVELVTPSPRVTRRVGPWCFDIALSDPAKVGGGNATGWDATALGSNAWHLRVDEVDASDGSFLYDLSVRSHVGGATIVVDEDGTDVAYTTMDAGGSGFPYWCKYEFGDIRAGGRDTFSKIGTTADGVMFDGFGVYDSTRGMMYRNSVRMSGNTADILALRVLGATGVTGTTPIQLIDSNGDDFPLNEVVSGFPVRECHYGATYDAENDRIWLWNSDADEPGRVYYIQIPAWDAGTGWSTTTWTINEVIPTGSTPRGGHIQGVLGKMRAVAALGAFAVLDSTTIDRLDDPAVWLFKTSSQNTLSGSGSIQGNASSTGAITQSGVFTGANCSQGNACSTGSISIDSGLDLTAANASQANEGAGGAISIDGAFVAAPSVQDNIASASAIVQAHILAASNVTQGNASPARSITLGDALPIRSVVVREGRFQRTHSAVARFN